jgi:hypothetical protein
MEGETVASVEHQNKMFNEWVLPTLDDNIRSGNSLIDLDFYDGQIDFDPKAEKKIKPFHWPTAFPEVFRTGGFDFVIGNPPYVRQELLRPEMKTYFEKRYKVYHGQADLYSFFFEKSAELLKHGGVFSAIVANKWMRTNYGEALRRWLRQRAIIEIIDFGDLPVFEQATAYPCIIRFRNEKVTILEEQQASSQDKAVLTPLLHQLQDQIKQIDVSEEKAALAEFEQVHGQLLTTTTLEQLPNLDKPTQRLVGEIQKATVASEQLQEIQESIVQGAAFWATNVPTLEFERLKDTVETHRFQVSQTRLKDDGWQLSDPRILNLLDKLKVAGQSLGDYVNKNVYIGVGTGFNEAFVIDQATRDRLIAEDPTSADIIKPMARGRDVKRYTPIAPQVYLIFARKGIDIKQYPAIEKHLLQYKDRLMPKPKDHKGPWDGRASGSYEWYELQTASNYHEKFKLEKIVYQKFQVKPVFTFDESKAYCNDALWFITNTNKTLLAILNSKLGWFLISNYCTQIQNGHQLIYDYLKQIPIAPANDQQNKDITALVDQLLALNCELELAKPGGTQELLQSKIQYCEKKLNTLVY